VIPVVDAALAARLPADQELPGRLRDALRRLRPAEREVFLLRRGGGLTCEGMARTHGHLVDTVKAQMRGRQKVVPSYSVMGPVKVALEAAVRYLAHELGL
jgi:DNA-directed RNA polymerase specialized sigma24 family protein